jgi:hypothetical protein
VGRAPFGAVKRMGLLGEQGNVILPRGTALAGLAAVIVAAVPRRVAESAPAQTVDTSPPEVRKSPSTVFRSCTPLDISQELTELRALTALVSSDAAAMRAIYEGYYADDSVKLDAAIKYLYKSMVGRGWVK